MIKGLFYVQFLKFSRYKFPSITFSKILIVNLIRVVTIKNDFVSTL